MFGGKGAPVELGTFDDVAVENTEDAIQVIGVEDGNIIEQDEVLVRGSAANIHAQYAF